MSVDYIMMYMHDWLLVKYVVCLIGIITVTIFKNNPKKKYTSKENQ